MLRRGCTLLVVLFGALFALYFFFFTRYFEWPGNLFAAGLGSLFGAMGLGRDRQPAVGVARHGGVPARGA